MTLLDRLNRYPPRLIRLLARKQHGQLPMSAADIALRGGLSVTRVKQISKARSWERIQIRTAQAFISGCGVDPMAIGPHLRYWRRYGLRFMKHAAPMQRQMYSELLDEIGR